MQLKMHRGTTSKIVPFHITKASDGTPYTGLLFNTALLVANFIRDGDSTPTAITLATMTVGTWATGGFVEVDNVKCPGLYELSVPNTGVSTGTWVAVYLSGASNIKVAPALIELDAVDYQDALGFGLVRIDAAISTRSTYAGGAVASVTAPVTVGTNSDKTGYALTAGEHTNIITDVWTTASTRILTAGTNIALAKGTGLTGLNDIPATAIVSSGAINTAAGAVSTVTTVGTLTTYTGNTPQTGDLFAILNPMIVTGAFTVPALVHAPTGGSAPTVVQIRQEMDSNSTKLANLDAAVSTRSTYAGGAVASVTAPVTVGTNNDKAGYSLAGAGLDQVVVETGINARQALSGCLSSAAAVTSGANTTTFVIASAANPATPRITATVDQYGNRSGVILSLPT